MPTSFHHVRLSHFDPNPDIPRHPLTIRRQFDILQFRTG
jgi:hypothetical protein